jgi:small-conductance mechanosensitive channel
MGYQIDWEFLLAARPLLTVVAVLILVASNALLGRAIERLPVTLDQRRRARRLARLSFLIALVSILMIIWAAKIKSAALMVGAFAVAIVIALRELLQGLNGWALKMTGGAFRIGDRVAVGDAAGEVIDYGLLTTRLVSREGPTAGALINVPNSNYLSKPLRNDSHGMRFIVRAQSVLVAKGDDHQAAREALKSAAEAVFGEYQDAARGAVAQFEKQHDCDFVLVDPQVLIKAIDDKGVWLELSLLVPVDAPAKTIDRILAAYLEAVRSAPAKQPATDPAPEGEGG